VFQELGAEEDDLGDGVRFGMAEGGGDAVGAEDAEDLGAEDVWG
jgi:hypothetical protein